MAIGLGEPIPQPPTIPLLGNLGCLDVDDPVQSLFQLAEKYGEIYKLTFVNRDVYVVNTNALVNECCDETRFKKKISAVLGQVRNGVHDGLFTAHGEEPNWGKAHRVLTPAFGPMPIHGMFDEMYDIASQLAMKWAREGPETSIMVTDDFTRLTLDTLALCAMDYRFNSFYHEEMHPFINAMGSFLKESGTRTRRPPLPSFLFRSADTQYENDIGVLRDTADGVVRHRKSLDPPSERKDLLAAMLNGKDPRTGEMLDDSSISDNLITFLIAGHETTSGLLSFAFYQLLERPDMFDIAQKEVDDVCGTGPITVEQLPKLHYIAAVLRETLRLNATIPAFTVTPKKDEIIGGKYFIPAGEPIQLLLMSAHLDPVVFGEDAREFKPERMLDENFERLNREFPNCWKPFGNGARACIGRPFAWQEALLVMAMLLQNFTFTPHDPSYQLHLKETLTIKPKDYHMHAHLRHGLTPTSLEHRLAGGRTVHDKAAHAASAATNDTAKGKPIDIYYGSNSGTCEALANRIAADAPANGFRANVLASLDDAKEKLPTGHPVVLITASYEGEPPDNAANFVSWLKETKPQSLDKVTYAVFGCGHHDWAQTFHKIPKLVDSKLEESGAHRVAPMGLTDAAEGNMFEDFEDWEGVSLFPALKEHYKIVEDESSPASTLDVKVSTPRTSTLRSDVREAQVSSTKVLTTEDSTTRKLEIEIKLPTGMTYRAGDYLAVLPFNSQASIERAMRRCHLPWDANVTVAVPEGMSVPPSLPINIPTPAISILGAYVELNQPATKRGVLALAEAATEEDTKAELQNLASDGYSANISAKRVSILDLLERYPKIDLPFANFLSLLPPMRVRQYSISSSPLWDPHRVTLSYSVLAGKARSGGGKFEGVATHYLSSLSAGDSIHVAVRQSHAAFHLPDDAENVPVVLIAAGTGLAPFRGFIQERAALIGSGRKLAPAILFFGCRGKADDIYREDLDHWEAAGAIDVRRAYSRENGDPQTKGCVHVQDRIKFDWEELVALWKQGARAYVCGSREMGESVKQTIIASRLDLVNAENTENAEKVETEEDALAWFEAIRNVRFATDVFD